MARSPDAVEPMDTDIFSKYPGLFGDLQTFFADITNPNRLTYVEIEDGSLIDEDDSKSSTFTEPREWSPLPFDDIIDEIDDIWKYTDDYVYIFSMSSCSDNPDFTGMARAITAYGTDGFSVIFWWTIKCVAEDNSLDEYDCVKKVLFHELGHQLVNLEDYAKYPGNHTDYNCIMRQGLEGALINDPHFCAGCVLNFRQYFMTF